jgi:hypothetical protein
MKEGIFVVCPFCGLNRKLNKTGLWAEIRGVDITTKKETRFDRLDPETAPFIDFRDCSGGRGKGYPRIRTLTIKESYPEYAWLIIQVRDQILKVADVLAQLNGTSKLNKG